MKYLFFTTVTLLCLISGYAQEISTDLPVLSPQSPTTSNLGKYGEIQVNESTGLISPSIPVFEYDAGKFSIPLSLNYSGNGVRVNQDPTWVGINWNINPGGVITRTVIDLPDELTPTVHRKYVSEEYLDNLDGAYGVIMNSNPYCDFDTSSDWFTYLKSLTFSHTDSEMDIFNYNFLGYSGSFYLDVNNEVHLIKYDKEISVSFQLLPDNQSIFLIKTPDGNSYFFGGPNGSESSSVVVNNGAGSIAAVPHVQNSFYLYKVSYLTGGSVDFHYENYDTTSDFQYNIGVQESASISYPMQVPCNKQVKILMSDVQNLVRLTEISNTFNDLKVVFNTSSYGLHNRMVKLNSLELKSNATLLKKVALNYLTIDNEDIPSEKKFFLENVTYYDKENIKISDYELEYERPEDLPSKDSFAQDLMGFYNGQTSNTTLLPRTNFMLLNENCQFGLANRNASEYFSKTGSLKKIVYPTGGYSEFEYELPYKGEVDVIENHYLSVRYRDEYSNSESSPHVSSFNQNIYSEGIYHSDGGDGPLILSENKTINVRFNIAINGNFSHNVVAKVTAFKYNGPEYSETFTINQGEHNNAIKNGEVNLSLTPGSYTFKFSMILNCADSHNCNNQNYQNNQNSLRGIADLSIPNGTRPEYSPGLRVKRVRTSDGGSNENLIRYYYNNRLNLTVESFQFHTNFVYQTYIPNANGEHLPLINLYNLSTSSVKNIFNSFNNQFIYNYITISYGGDNFEKGGKQMEFIKYYDHPPTFYNYSRDCPFEGLFTLDYIGNTMNAIDAGNNDSYQNSVLKEEQIFNSNLKTINKKSYFYEGTIYEQGFNIKTFDFAVTPLNQYINKMFFLYNTNSYKYRLLSTKETEYFGNDFSNEVEKNTNYTFSDDKVSLPSIITTENSKGETIKTMLFYPSDAPLLSNLSTNQVSLINNLQVGKHNLSEIIRSENYIENTLMEAKQKVYANFSGNILPTSIQASKSNNSLTDRVKILSYNFSGSPTLLKKENGTLVKYIYNTNQQVIYKIENYDTSFIIDDGLVNSGDCFYQELYPTCMVTSYKYDSLTNKLLKVVDPKCDVTNFEYDDFGRLFRVYDNQGNPISENQYHYKTQN
ncbi:hypothetical protein [Flavobacterium sp.]|uniref:hypothetical protein n=1 Tax=Flavobacterium sp. TaxID=239 RepID=UPI00391BDF72